MAAVTTCYDFGAQENKVCCYFHCFPIYFPDAMILVFWMLRFKPVFSLSSFTLIKRPFIYSLLSAIRVVSSAYLKLLIFLPAILIPTCASSSPASRMMYSAQKLNKQGENMQPFCTPFPIWNQSVVPCPVLTVAPWKQMQTIMSNCRGQLLGCWNWLCWSCCFTLSAPRNSPQPLPLLLWHICQHTAGEADGPSFDWGYEGFYLELPIGVSRESRGEAEGWIQ